MELKFWSLMIKTSLNIKSQETEKFKLFSQRIYDFQNLGYETLVITD